MAKFININRNVDDMFYRYKMPGMVLKHEGRGNGCRSVLTNLVEVSKALRRSPEYLMKFFGSELGSNYWIQSGRYILNGHRDLSDLDVLLDKFISLVVLCPTCQNPETVLSVYRKSVFQRCKACGYGGITKANHKLVSFIFNKLTSETKSSRKNKKINSESSNNPTVVDPSNSTPSDDEWGDEDFSEEAIRDRAINLVNNGVSSLVKNDDQILTRRLDLFSEYVTQCDIDSQCSSIYGEAQRLGVSDKGIMVLVEYLLLDSDDVMKKINSHSNLFLRFTANNLKAQNYLMGAIEVLVTERSVLLPKITYILHKFYELDILDLETITDWASKSSKKYVSKEKNKTIREKCTQYVEWINEDDSEDDGTVFSSTLSNYTHQQEITSDSDLDIDNI